MCCLAGYIDCSILSIADNSNAQKRLKRMRVEVPQSFREIKVRTDVVERIDAFLLAAGRFRYRAQLGKTNWSRNVVLYSRKPVHGISYA